MTDFIEVTNRQGVKFNAREAFVIITCYKCGMPFGVPDHWQTARREDQELFYCPNGHSQYYSNSEAQRLREQLALKERQLTSAKMSERFYRDRAETEKRRAAAQKGIATKRKKQLDRVANGVCPCCNRHFENLQRHMETKHPEYGDD